MNPANLYTRAATASNRHVHYKTRGCIAPSVDTVAITLISVDGLLSRSSLALPPFRTTRNSLSNLMSQRLHKYHLLAGISTILAISSVTLVFFYLPSKTVLYALLVLPTLSLLHHIFVFLAIPSPIAGPSSQWLSHQGCQRCALSGSLSEIEKSTLNLLSLALLAVLAMASGSAAWLFIALNCISSTTPTSNTATASWSNSYTAPVSALWSLAPERGQPSPAAMWILQGGGHLAQAIVLASMLAIAAREARISTMATMAGRSGCASECGHTGSDVEQLMCIEESRPEIDTVMAPGDDEYEKGGSVIPVEE